ncbi:MAG: hypothetical protein RMI91_15320, partial [Gemmatales bacterium]|nr:hypothetical protein [Gemmatales bacterium]
MSYFLTKHLKTNDISIPTDYALWSHLHDAIYTYPVQVYARGKLQGKYYLCDANNLYLAVAKDTKLPGTIATSIILPTAQQVINLVRKYICIAFCYVRKCQYPFVYSSTEEQKTNPPDKAWLWLSAKELEIALDYNCLEQVIVIYAFRQSQSLPEYAADCLEKLCELKRTHDKLFYRGLKHILLAALGKFATRGYRTIPMPNYPALSWYGFTPPPTKSKSGFFYAYAFGHTYKIEWGFPTSISAPQIFACITANSRVHMFQLLSGVDKS